MWNIDNYECNVIPCIVKTYCCVLTVSGKGTCITVCLENGWLKNNNFRTYWLDDGTCTLWKSILRVIRQVDSLGKHCHIEIIIYVRNSINIHLYLFLNRLTWLTWNIKTRKSKMLVEYFLILHLNSYVTSKVSFQIDGSPPQCSGHCSMWFL